MLLRQKLILLTLKTPGCITLLLKNNTVYFWRLFSYSPKELAIFYQKI